MRDETIKGMMVKKDSDIEKVYSTAEFVVRPR